MTDPIQHLRALQSAAYFIAYPVRYHNASYSIIDSTDDIICDSISEVNGRLIVAAINALPALLAVAEAARKVIAEYERDRGRRGSDCPFMGVIECDLERALAKLDEVKP